MKLSINTDFTALVRAEKVIAAGAPDLPPPAGRVSLAHDDRHLRRKAIRLEGGENILVDLPEPVHLQAGDRLVLADGRQIEVGAEPEELLAILPRDALHLAELAWHIGNRHLAAQIEADRILILRDHVIKAMIEGLGAGVEDVVEPFSPVPGAYSGHGHGDHHHGHAQGGHGEPDRYGRMPDDPHYGHDHG